MGICQRYNEKLSLRVGEERVKNSNMQRELLFEVGSARRVGCQRDKENLSLRVGEERVKNSNMQRELLFEVGCQGRYDKEETVARSQEESWIDPVSVSQSSQSGL